MTPRSGASYFPTQKAPAAYVTLLAASLLITKSSEKDDRVDASDLQDAIASAGVDLRVSKGQRYEALLTVHLGRRDGHGISWHHPKPVIDWSGQIEAA